MNNKVEDIKNEKEQVKPMINSGWNYIDGKGGKRAKSNWDDKSKNKED